eukprot:189720-Rhodomonas_salina.2
MAHMLPALYGYSSLFFAQMRIFFEQVKTSVPPASDPDLEEADADPSSDDTAADFHSNSTSDLDLDTDPEPDMGLCVYFRSRLLFKVGYKGHLLVLHLMLWLSVCDDALHTAEEELDASAQEMY